MQLLLSPRCQRQLRKGRALWPMVPGLLATAFGMHQYGSQWCQVRRVIGPVDGGVVPWQHSACEGSGRRTLPRISIFFAISVPNIATSMGLSSPSCL